MLKGVGSSKVRNANKRIAKEKAFLDSLSVRCDDVGMIDSVIGNDGQALPVKQVMAVAEHHEGIRFAIKGVSVSLETIVKSFQVIDQCQKVVGRFS